MARVDVGESANGCKVFIETENSHASTHLEDTPGLLDLVKEAVPKVTLVKQEERIEYDMGRIVGTRDLIETKEGDEIFYAKRPHRDRYSRFVKNKKPVPTSSLVLRFVKTSENEYQLYTT